MADGAAPDVRFGYLLDGYGGLHPGGYSLAFQDVLKGEGVYHRSQHAGVVSGDAVHAFLFRLCPPPDVAAANDNAHTYLHGDYPFNLLGDLEQGGGVNAVGGAAAEGFAAEFEKDPLVFRLAHSSFACSPNSKRANRLTLMFSPTLAMVSVMMSSMVSSWSLI
ncbi:hypothetical protein ES703_97968 [subsurface metagenome]